MKANLHIQVSLRDGISYLKNLYATTPFKVADITEDKKSNPLSLMLMSSSPGILDGDEYAIKIEQEEHTALQLHTQSYQRLFNMKKTAQQVFEVTMGKGSSFCYLPHPSVPHQESSFTATNRFYLSQKCSLIFGEILTCGRKLNGESFLFSKYHNLTEIFIDNRLVVKENLLIQPSLIDTNAIGQLEGFTHQASLIYLDEQANIKLISEEINGLLQNNTEMIYGVSAAPVNGLIVRVLGQKAEPLFKCLKSIAGILPQNNIINPTPYAV